MAIPTPKKRITSDIPSSSMADIAFLLLVFFLVTTVFPRDRGLQLVLPEDTPQEVPADNVLHFLIDPSGVVEVRHGDSPRSQRVATEMVGDVWLSAVRDRPGLIAAVKTHDDAAYRHTINVLDELKKVGATRISLQALSNQP